MTEMELINFLTKRIPRKKGALRTGIGDDCSVIRVGYKDILITCDNLVENIHFKKKWGPWQTWGHKAAATALSDIAAMGGTPRFAWVNLEIPKNMNAGDIKKFYAGFLKVLKQFDTILAGGNITRSPKYFGATTTVWGEAPKGKAMLRKNAKPGDKVYISDSVGGKSFTPTPHIQLGQQILKRGCRCCIDVSDGLLQDLGHIAKASKVKIILRADKIPHKGNLKEALTNGEDYILAFTGNLPYSNRYHMVGEVRRGKPGVEVINKKGGLLLFSKQGFQHRVADQ
ncbi:MAG: thiamine-monophosphate kinase [Deltaproteobacteria bacterium]|nr:thiamine-monophosphate kinase [Deltaproteobacteria bacterium]